MTPYLRQHQPARAQFRSPRRKRPTGLIVLHTAESVLDTVGPDTGAENVARFIRHRDTPGSYHDLVDSDSLLHLVAYGDEAFQDGTGSNPFALSIAWALKAADWSRLTPKKRAAFLAQGAAAFARQQRWLAAHGYPTTPLRRVTKAEADRGLPGFIAHGTRDPDRRTDPGADFPWQEWFAACTPYVQEDDDMTPAEKLLLSQVAADVTEIKEALAALVRPRRQDKVDHDPNAVDLGDILTKIETETP
jgi:hypothetical protein